MHKRASVHLYSLLWVFLAVLIIGLIIDQLVWSLLLFFAAYSAWAIWQSLRLHNWLYSPDANPKVPESYGLWGDLFDGLHLSQKQNKKARKRLKKMIGRVRRSANALKDAVIMTDALGQMDWWNKAAERMFGFDTEKDQAQLITNLLRDPEFKAYFEAKEYDQALEITSPFGHNAIIRIQITLFGKNDRLILAQNVTRLHQLEQMRKDFVSNVSHEMRTPLTVIRGYVETMLDNEPPSQWRRALESMEGQAQRLESLVSDLLLLEKYETSDEQSVEEPIDMGHLIASVCRDAELLSAHEKHNIRFYIESTSSLLGSESQIRSAVSNIVFNAVKYTPEGGDINVVWGEDHTGCHLTVSDTGCGFDPIHIPRLTERFYRADPSRNHKTGGSGLGLAIVKHVLINHDATLEVASELGKGSEFICHFPLERVVDSASDQAESH